MAPQLQSLEARRMLAAVLDDSYGDNGFVPGGKIFSVVGRQSDGTALFTAEYTPSKYTPDDGLLIRPVRPDGTIVSSYQQADEYDNSSSNDFVVDSKNRIIWYGDAYHYTDDYLTSGYRPTLDRFLPNGAHDDSFTQSVLPDPPKYKGLPADIIYSYDPKIDSHDRILAESEVDYRSDPIDIDPTYTREYLDRYRTDGSRDTSFADNGRLLISTTPHGTYTGVSYAVTPDDKIIVLRRPENDPATLTRYTAGGQLDTSYGDHGVVTLTDNTPDPTIPKSAQLVVDAQGRAVLAYTRDDRPKRLLVRRFTTSGALDTTFGTNGLTSWRDPNFGGGSVDFLSMDDHGRMVGSMDYALFRVTADGTPDWSFAPNAVINTGNEYQAEALVTPEGIYTPSVIGKTEGTARFVDTGTITLNAKSGELSVIGTLKADSIRVRPKGNGVGVTLNGDAEAVYRNVKSLRISALRGDDSVTTSVSVPTFVGLGDGDDLFSGTGGKAYTVLGGAGDDKIATGDAADSVNGGLGDDTVYANGGNDTVTDLDGNNSVHGGAGNDSIKTGDGRDVLYGDDGNDTLRAGGGVDHLYGNDDNDLLFGGSGFSYLSGGQGQDRGLADGFAGYQYDTLETLLPGND